MLSSSTQIQQSQNNLSNTYLRDVFQDSNNNLINPSTIQLIYNTPCAMPMFYYVDIWSAIMAVAVHALTIKDLALSAILNDNSSVYFIIQNCLNNILDAVYTSTKAILDETQNISDTVEQTLQILLYVATGSLFLSICLIFPVATKVDKNKDELLRHFMLIDREDVKKQLEKCRIFFNTMHDKEHVTQQNMGEMDEDEFKEDGDGKEEDGDPSNPNKGKNKQRQRSRKNKMHKKFSTNFVSLLIKFICVLTIMEGYFVLCYLRSIAFLSVINNLIQESGSITMIQFSNNYLYIIFQEVLTTNGVAQVQNKNSLAFMFSFLNSTINSQEAFLKTHSNNAPYHSDQYNSFFNQLIYQDVCSAVYSQDSTKNTACGSFMGGILEKGLYSANVAFWDNMRSITTDFNNSARDTTAINTFLNSASLIQNEQLKDIYFSDSYSMLSNQLDASISYNFETKDKEDTILFSVYIVLLFLMYFILWNKFIEATRHSLWVTKSMLAIIPLEIIQKVPKIKDFLLASSKNTLSAFKD